jgi:hypothetical protein
VHHASGCRHRYACNRGTFDSFVELPPSTQLVAVLTNPLHHTNSTALADWAMRRPGAHVHLMQRYTTAYWTLLAAAAVDVEVDALPGMGDAELAAKISQRGARARVVAPLVSRHSIA